MLIGGNGSGKTTLASILKGSEHDFISVIPAQKIFHFSIEDEYLRTKIDEAKDALLENNIESIKEDFDYVFSTFYNSHFTKLIIAMKEELNDYLRKCQEERIVAECDKTVFDRMRKIFRTLFPEIDIQFGSSGDEYIYCEKNGKRYSINGLSEGEKAVIYYTVSVLVCAENGFIVVDEPETYLNPSIAKPLWDTLISERQDCKFVFITHSVDFVMSRNDSQIVWIKNVNHPNDFEFEPLDDNYKLPKQMITEILGSKKPLLFCEGENKNSIDYSIYSILFGRKYTVVPVKGHKNVIQYCRMINSEWSEIECRGIIDGDSKNNENIKKYEDEGIIVLPFNEIEMFLMCDELLKHTFTTVRPIEGSDMINDFKSKFWTAVDDKKENIALKYTKSILDERIEHEKIEDEKSIEGIKSSIKKIGEYDVDSVYTEKLREIKTIIEKKEYEKMLKICNLKGEISKGVANKYIKDYVQVVKEQLANSLELQDEICNKYFSEL